MINRKLFKKILKHPRTFWTWGNDVIAIYTLGKVGSSTIYRTLKRYWFTPHVYHVHFLRQEAIQALEGTPVYEVNHRMTVPFWWALKNIKPQRVHYISLIREPIGREISNVFENPHSYFEEDVSTLNSDFILKRFIERVDFTYYENWFDDEFKAYTGINIYDHPFDREKGWQILEFQDKRVLLMTLESFKTTGAQALSRFLGIRIPELINANEGEQKTSKDQQRNLKEAIRFSEEQLDQIYGSPVVQHFYSSEDVERFKLNWLESKQ